MRYTSKQFLSPCAGETGSIVVSLETPRVKDLYRYDATYKPNMSAGVSFRACHGEPVHLDFDCQDQKGFDKRQTKLNLMIDELTKMRDQMTEMWYSHLRDVEFKNKTEDLK